MKYILLQFFSLALYFPSSAQLDTTKIPSSISHQDSLILGYDVFGIGGCFETIRYLKKDGTIKKEILDDKNGRRIYITYKRNKKESEVKYNDKWAMNSTPRCGMVIEIKD